MHVMFGRKKKLDTGQLFETCMQKGTEFILKATDISTYLRSPFQLYCNYFADASERDSMPDQYMEQLAVAGIEHETDINEEQFPDAVPVEFATPEEGFTMVVDAMSKGVKSFTGAPLFYLPYGMYGTVDQLVRAKENQSLDHTIISSRKLRLQEISKNPTYFKPRSTTISSEKFRAIHQIHFTYSTWTQKRCRLHLQITRMNYSKPYRESLRYLVASCRLRRLDHVFIRGVITATRWL